jgi:hypothetical protein
LNYFKIQISKIVEFVFQNLLRIGSLTMNKVVPLEQIYQPTIFHNFLEVGKVPFSIFEFRRFETVWIILENSKTEMGPPVSGV